MIAILEVHDATGKKTESELLEAATYFVGIQDILIGNEGNVIVNIANEWDGDSESTIWESGNRAAIKILGDAGIKNTLLIDAAV